MDSNLVRTDANGSRSQLTDRRGSVVASTDAAGTIQSQSAYAPYGQQVVSGESTAGAPGFTGRTSSSTTGLQYNRDRYYNPALGRFISQDPIGQNGGLNTYAYAGGDPINAVDPTGDSAGALGGGFGSGGWGGLGGAGGLPSLGDLMAGAVGKVAVGALRAYSLYQRAPLIAPTVLNEVLGGDGENQEGTDESRTSGTPPKPNFENPTESPGDDWEWRGSGPPESNKGNWVNPDTEEWLHNDMNHGDPIGPHFDWGAPDGKDYRIFPDGRVELK